MADWRDDYRAKLMTADQAAQLVRSGDSIFVGGGSSIPLEFSQALADRSAELENVDFYAALALFPLKVLDGEMKGRINYHTIFTGRFERMKAPEGNVNQLSVHLAETDRFIRERAKPTVLSVNVSPPDKHGWMTFGPAAGMGQHEALKLASTTIVTVQPTQPRVYGEFNTIHVSQVDAIVETEIPIASLPSAPPTDLENQIASHVVPLVPDGATIQIGIGGVPGAVAHSLAEKKNLGIHRDVQRRHVLLGAGRRCDRSLQEHSPGKVVFSFAAGGPDLMNYVDDNPECVILPLSRAINDHDCGKNDSFVSINTASWCLLRASRRRSGELDSDFRNRRTARPRPSRPEFQRRQVVLCDAVHPAAQGRREDFKHRSRASCGNPGNDSADRHPVCGNRIRLRQLALPVERGAYSSPYQHCPPGLQGGSASRGSR